METGAKTPMPAAAATATVPALDDNEVIPARYLGGLEGVTRGEAIEAFDSVAPKDNWKRPIDAVIKLDTAGANARKKLIEQAVIYFTGSIPTFERLTNNANGVDDYRVKGRGYYNAIGS